MKTEYKYSIDEKDMGQIFKILRGTLYSDIIGSICREVASNSRDANREAKNPNPIEISIEVLDSTTYIMFKDKGVGISPDRMADVFCKFASSTKRNDENLTGGFGIGAKTPFAYTDKFNVITTYNGKKYEYVSSLDAGNGKISLVKEAKTKDSNGTEIQIPIVNYTDIQTFEKKVIYFTQFWTQRPILKNFTSHNYDDISYVKNYGNDDIKIIEKTNNFYGSLLALVDEIPYKIDESKVNINRHKMLYDGTIVFKFKKNDVSVSASRETLYFDETTIKAVSDKFKKSVNLFAEQFKNELNKCDYIDFCIKINEISSYSERGYAVYSERNIFHMINNNDDKIVLSGNESHKDYMPAYKDGRTHIQTLIIPGKGNIIEKIASKKISATEAKVTYTLDSKYSKKIIYWMNESRKSAEKNLTLFNENNGSYMFLTQSKKDEGNTEVFDKPYKALRYLRKLGFEIMRYSFVEKTKIESVKKEKKVDGGFETITGLIWINSENYRQTRHSISIKADKANKTISAVYDKVKAINIKIPDGTFAIKVNNISDLKSETALIAAYPEYAIAIKFAGDVPVLILNKASFDKLEKYVSLETNVNNIFHNAKVDEILRNHTLLKDRDIIQKTFNNIFNNNDYYGSSIPLNPTNMDIICEILDIDNDMKKTMTNIASLFLSVSSRYRYNSMSAHTIKLVENILSTHRTDIGTSNSSFIVNDLKELQTHIFNTLKRKPLLNNIKLFFDKPKMLNELKKYSYACDVLFL